MPGSIKSSIKYKTDSQDLKFQITFKCFLRLVPALKDSYKTLVGNLLALIAVIIAA